MMRDFDLLIIGNGPASHRLLCDMAAANALPARVGVIGDESRTAYNRILLSPLLAGEMGPDQLALALPDNGDAVIEQITDCHIDMVDAMAKQVMSQDGRRFGYRQLVLATGARPIIPAMPNNRARGVMAFRTWQDVDRMRMAASEGGRAVVVGGGFLGLEAAEGLRKLGMDVTLIHRSGYLLNRQLDEQAGLLLQQQMAARGLTIKLSSQLASIDTLDGAVNVVTLQSGECLPADILVFATGIVPNISLADSAGLAKQRGILVDAQMRTSDPAIFALGECVEFEGQTYGLVAPIWRQAAVLATVLAGQRSEYMEQAFATQLKISGIDLFSCGDIGPSDQGAFYFDEDCAHYRRFWYDGDRLVGAVMYGDTSRGPQVVDAIVNGVQEGTAALIF